jgi:exodeoxyribonuclease VIII
MNEIIQNMPFADYRSAPGVNVSVLKWIRRSPRHAYYHAYDEPEAEKPSWQMVLGSAVDCLLLEGPEAFEASFVIPPEISKNSSEYKAWAAGESRQIIDGKHARTAQAMVEAARRKWTIRDILGDGLAQVSVFWEDPGLNGLQCKGRIDWIGQDHTVWDLKTTGDAGWYGFGRSVDRWAYHWQAAWYLRGLSVVTGIRHDKFGWLVVENEAPYESIVYRADRELLDRGWAEVYAAAAEYEQCVATGEWPGYPDEIQEL